MKLRYHGLHLLFGVAAALLAVIAWAFWWEPSSLRVTEHPLPLLHWPASQSGLRIAVITDVHAGAPFIDRAKLRKIVTMTNAAHPDLTVLLGDYVIDGIPGGHFIPPEDVARILGGLRAPLGVYGVVGNYDDALGLQRVIRAFDAAGIPMLENRLEHINSGRFHFALLGIDSNSLDLPRIDQQFHLLGADEPVIMLMHHPDVFPMLPARVNLALAGHTHGGQVRLPLF
ncbi:MAG: metallophosphoesterase, partial [Stenotrophobium sp.]